MLQQIVPYKSKLQEAPFDSVETKPSNAFSLDRLVSDLRWLWLTLVVAYVIVQSLFGQGVLSNLPLLLLLVGLGFVLNGIGAGLLWAKLFPNWLGGALAIWDAVLAIALLVILDEHAQLLLPLMLFPVIMAGVRWNGEVGILIALLLVVGYALPLLPITGEGNIGQSELITGLLTLGGNALTLFLAGTLPDPFIRQRVKQAQQANQKELGCLQVANERNKLIAEMAATLSSTLDYRSVLQAMINLAFKAMTRVDGIQDESTIGMVLLYEGDDDGSDKLTVVAGHNIARTDRGRKVRSDSGLISQVIQTAEAAIAHNLQKESALTSLTSIPGFRSAICAPLRAGYDTYGVVLFCSRALDFYHEDHKALLTTFCSQAIIALKNAQLFEALKNEQQKILDKETEARHKLARDLHDGPTQSIAAIAMRLNFIKLVLQNKDADKAYAEIVKVEEIAQKTTQEIRTMLFAMRPVILETKGLVSALNGYAERLNANESFRVTIINQGYEGQLTPKAENTIFAIIEEAVGNAKKHSRASEIRITLKVGQAGLLVEVRDNGVGFNVKATQSTYDQRSSLGLINLEERSQLIGGRCTIDSVLGRGTAVRVAIPLVKLSSG